MDIGGLDFVIDAPNTPEVEGLVEKFFRKFWPSCIFDQDGEHPMLIWYVFRSRADHEAWELNGGTVENQDEMASILFAPSQLTIVVGPESVFIYKALQAYLARELR